MAKRKGLSYEEKMILALSTLPNPLEDKKHRLLIVFENDKARSNQTRFEHIIDQRHELKPNDIKRIPKCLKASILKQDKERKNTYNLYILRRNYGDEFIKISLDIDYRKTNIATVRTIYITKNYK